MMMPTCSGSAPGAGVPEPTSSGAPDAASPAAAKPAPPPAPQARATPIQPRFVGVRPRAGGGWMAHVPDPHRPGAERAIGPFREAHAAALAHDRVAIAVHGDRARANFRAGFHAIEQRFLRLCQAQRGRIDVCALVAGGAYEDRYATFLRSVLERELWGEYLDVVVEFFVHRYKEIGEEALKEGANEKLVGRFVDMHRNKALNPGWRKWYYSKIMSHYAEKRKQESVGGTGSSAIAVQPQPMEQQQQPMEQQ